MTEQALKLMSYFALIFIALYAVLSAFGRRDQISTQKPRPRPVAKGSVWSQFSVPAASTQQPAAAIPTPLI